MLAQAGDAPVYGPNLRASCRRMEAAGWLRTLRAPNLQLAVELTHVGCALAAPLLTGEQTRAMAERRATDVRILPLVPERKTDEAESLAGDRLVEIDDIQYMACMGVYVIRLDGSTCLKLLSMTGMVVRLPGDPLQTAQWLQICHDAGLDIQVQINENTILVKEIRD